MELSLLKTNSFEIKKKAFFPVFLIITNFVRIQIQRGEIIVLHGNGLLSDQGESKLFSLAGVQGLFKGPTAAGTPSSTSVPY